MYKAHVRKILVLEEASVQKIMIQLKTKTEQITAAGESADEEGKLKKGGIEGVKKKEKEVTIKLSLVETVMTKKLETRQLLQNKLDNFVKEGKLRSLMESKRKDFLQVEKTKKSCRCRKLKHQERK